jgi:hypothetical protein
LFVSDSPRFRDHEWRDSGDTWGMMGVWLGGGYAVIVLPLSLLIWAVFVR